MKKLSEMPDDSKFYRGTIIIIKGAHISPEGAFDIKYAMIGGSNSTHFFMLDLYRSIGSCILFSMKPNIERHFAVDKQGIFDWVKEYFELFYTKDGQELWIPQISDIVYVDDLDEHFTQANRDLFMK
jgi:hypothetical protein